LAEDLLSQSIYTTEQLNRALRVPTAEQARRLGLLVAIGEMVALDVLRVFRIAALRRAGSGVGGTIISVGGLFSSGNHEVERVVRLIRQKSALSKRVVFLAQTQRIFHLWHVIHRPFSYAFAVLALVHIAVVLGLGFGTMGFR